MKNLYLSSAKSILKYWRDKKKHEMDFIISKDNKIIQAIEAKSSGKLTKSFNAFKRKYPDIPAKIVSKENVFQVM